MKIVADENIPALEHYFGGLGELETLPGRSINARMLSNADILLVRSVTKVTKALLADSSVRFVGSATIGVDHIDTDYLSEKNICFAHAPGSNAQSVVEYVFSAIWSLSNNLSPILDKQFAVIGCGNVGSRLALQLKSLGCDVIAYDPLIEPISGIPLVSLDEALGADIISLHTPLTLGGQYPTHHMLHEEKIARIKPGSLLINSGRGAVIDNGALLQRLKNKSDLLTVLDVWEHEPAISLELMELVSLATPHIAGYSLDGKLAGTGMLYEALCQHLELKDYLPKPGLVNQHDLNIELPQTEDRNKLIGEMIRQVYNIAADDKRMREALSPLSQNEQLLSKAFDLLRKNYPVRREWINYRVTGGNLASAYPALFNLFRQTNS